MSTVSKKMLMILFCLLVICACACTHQPRVISDQIVFDDILSVSKYLAADIQLKFDEYLHKEALEAKKEAEKYGETQKIENIKPSIVVGYFMTSRNDTRNMCCKELEGFIRSNLSIEQAIDCDTLKQIRRYQDMIKTDTFDPDHAIKGLMADARFIISARLNLQKHKKLIIIILDCRDTQRGKSAFSSSALLSFDDKDIQEAWHIPAPFCDLNSNPDKSKFVRFKETGRGESRYLAKTAAKVLVNKNFVGKCYKPWLVSYTLLTNDEIEKIITFERLEGWVPNEIDYRLLDNKQGIDGLWSATVIGEMPKVVLKRYADELSKIFQLTQPLPFIQNFN